MSYVRESESIQILWHAAIWIHVQMQKSSTSSMVLFLTAWENAYIPFVLLNLHKPSHAR